MSEINLRHAVRDVLKPAFVQQVENVVGIGTADTYCAFQGVSAWIELKYADEVPKRSGTAVFKSINRGLEVEQEAWLYECARGGGNAWVLAKIQTKHYLVPGMIAHDFNVMTMDQFRYFEFNLGDLKKILRFYSPRNDEESGLTKCSKFPYSIWYSEEKHSFFPAEGTLYVENYSSQDQGRSRIL